MPSPFPGMDPKLEHPALWPGVLQGLITYATEALNASLPPRYVANIGERVYVVQSERDGDPDVSLDLQAVFSRCYDACGYARRLDYRLDPHIRIEGEDADWAGKLLTNRPRMS